MALCGVTYTEFPDLAGLNSEITLVPITDLVPFHSRIDAGLRVKRLKELSSSAELVLVATLVAFPKNGPTPRSRFWECHVCVCVVVVTKPQRSGDLDGEVHSRSRPYFFYTKPLHTSNNDIEKKNRAPTPKIQFYVWNYTKNYRKCCFFCVISNIKLNFFYPLSFFDLFFPTLSDKRKYFWSHFYIKI